MKLYNDGYEPILGAKHPAALGCRGHDVWQEIWHLIGPMLNGVLERGEATWSENILLPLEGHGFAEECYFTFSYSPIRDEAGKVGGIFTAVTETPGRMLSERRQRTLHRLSERAAGSPSVAATVDAVTEALGAEVPELPFFALYHLDAGQVRMAGAAGLSSAIPAIVAVEALLALVRRGALPVDEMTAVLGIAPLASPVPQRAVALAILRAGSDEPHGVLVCGLSPMLVFDARYEEFLTLLAQQVGTSLDTARAAEDARKRAEKIVLNLLSNALKFTFEVEVEVTLRDDFNIDQIPKPILKIPHRDCLILD